MSKGFTLLEILISMAILTGVVFAISSFGLDAFDFGIFLGENLTAQQEIQLTLKSMTSEVRAMTQSVSGSYPIESASQNSITFYSDIDGNCLSEKIRYYLQGNTFYKGTIEASGNPLIYDIANEKVSEMIHNIYAPAGNIFSYYDGDYSGTEPELPFPVNIPEIRLVEISITVDSNPVNPTSRINFSTSVNMRNL